MEMKAIFTVEASGEVSQGFVETERGNVEIKNHQKAYDDLHTNEKLSSEEMEDGSYDVEIEVDEIEIMLYSDSPTKFTMTGREEYEISPASGVRMPIYELEDWMVAINKPAERLFMEMV